MNEVKSILRKELNAVKKAIEEKMAAEKATASGKTMDSLQVVVSDTEGTLFGAKHIRQLEKGRAPGRVPENFTAIIKEWIMKKGINYDSYTPKGRNAEKMTREQHLNSLAGAIAFNIMRNGTVLFRSGKPRDIYTDAVNEAVVRIKDSIGNIMEKRIQTINDNYRAYENN